ncbi:MAG: phosphonate ABC transporter, permease protein PhnE [Proteobacteria bacterium]|jgi:phosphonate ABC transporter, permease protein PhnE|nr:MAG: phosphonate ABC transporter, permease protein PhnE [Pseudomonadota bacterium]
MAVASISSNRPFDHRIFAVEHQRRRARWRSAAIAGTVTLLAAICLYNILVIDTDWERMGSLGEVLTSIGRFLAVDFELIPHLVEPIIETLMMSALGTALGAILCIPVIWLGALNITPSRWIGYPIGRMMMTLSRSIHEIVWALVFVSAVGLGSLAGILALAMRSIGFIAKIIAEAIENVDPKPIEAIRAVGGNRLQVLRYGIVPQVLPVAIGVIIFEWDINIRRSAVMGLVGAGGLGLTFHRQMVMFNYPGVTTVILAILLLIILGEALSYYARKAVI